MNGSAIIWLVLMLVFLVVEASTVTMVSLWFAAGSLAAMVISFVNGPGWLQVAVFFVVSGILLALLRPLVRKHITPKITQTNVDSVLGAVGIVSVAIDNVEATGQVKLGAMVWTARSTTGEAIPEGTLVKVDKVEGVKILVSLAEVTANT